LVAATYITISSKIIVFSVAIKAIFGEELALSVAWLLVGVLETDASRALRIKGRMRFSKFVLVGEAKEAPYKSTTTLDFVEGWYYLLIDEQKSSILYRL
jgi:hypothetical protein